MRIVHVQLSNNFNSALHIGVAIFDSILRICFRIWNYTENVWFNILNSLDSRFPCKDFECVCCNNFQLNFNYAIENKKK